MNDADRILWRAWRANGNEDAFADIVRPHLAFATDFARRLGLHDADADDLVQQALAALAAEKSDRPVDVGLRAWFGRFLVLHAKILRRAGVRRSRHERAAPPAIASTTMDYESREAVEALVRELPDPQRQAVILRYMHDLDYEEIAHVTGASVNACRIRVHRGIERLRAKAGPRIGALLAALPLASRRSEAALLGGATKTAMGALLMKKTAAVLLLCAATAGVLLHEGRAADDAPAPRVAARELPAAAPVLQDERPEEPPAAPKESPDVREAPQVSTVRDRLVRAVFEAGGHVGFASDGEPVRFFKPGDPLPEGPVTAVMLLTGNPEPILDLIAKEGTVHTLSLFGTEADDDDLALLGKLGALRELDISRTKISDAGLEQLVALPLRSLSLHDTAITEDGVRAIARITTLETLRFDNKKMPDTMIAHVARLPRLRQLGLPDMQVTAKGLKSLEGAAALRQLTLERVAPGALAGLANLTQLAELEVAESSVRGEDLRHLAGLRNLRRLDLGETQVDGKSLSHLAGLVRLERLELDETRLDDDSLGHLANLTALKQLRLDETGITSKGVAHLAGLAALERLDLDDNEVGDDAIESIVVLRKLRHLDLKGTQISAAGLARLRRELPGCSIRKP